MARKGVVSISASGNTKNLDSFFKKCNEDSFVKMLHRYGELGVQMLADKTPKDTGLTAASWYYTVNKTRSGYTIYWNNSNDVKGTPIVIWIQYGHATRNGGYVPPNDFINPVTQELYEAITNEIRKELEG